MAAGVLSYIGSLAIMGWGIAHLIPTRKVVAAFGEISEDNKRIITMEWITEGVALVFIGILNAAVTYLDRSNSVTRVVYWVSFSALNTLSVVSLYTGFRNSLIVFKLCPFIFTLSSILIVAGGYLG